jgi:hypothetical protein
MSGKGEARYRLTLDVGPFESALHSVARQFEEFGGTLGKAFGVGGAFALGEKAAEALAESIKAVPEAVIGAVEHLAEYSHTIEIAAAKTNLSTDTIQKLGIAARLTGTDLGTMTSLVGKMEKGIGEGKKAFEEMGLSISKLKAMSPDEAFKTVVERLRDIHNTSEQAAAGAAAFGKAWQEAAAIIKNPEALNAAQELGAVLSHEDVEAAANLAKEAKALGIAWEAVQNQFAAVIARSPALTQLFTTLVQKLADTAHWIDTHRNGINAMVEMVISWGDMWVRQAEKVLAVAKEVASNPYFQAMFPGALDVAGGIKSIAGMFGAQTAYAHAELSDAAGGQFNPQAEEEMKKHVAAIDKARREYDASMKALETEMNQFLIRTHHLAAAEDKKFWDEQLKQADDYGRKLLASITHTNSEIVASDKMLDEAQKAYFSAMQRGEPTLANKKALIDSNTQAHIREIEQLVKEGNVFEDDARLAIDFYRKAGEEEKKYAAQVDLLKHLTIIGQALEQIGQTVGGSFGKVASFLGAVTTQFAEMRKAVLDGADAWQKVAMAIQATVNAYNQGFAGKSPGKGALSGAASGAATGFAYGGGAGAVVGAIVGGIAGFIGGKKGQAEELRQLGAQFGDLMKQAQAAGIVFQHTFDPHNAQQFKAAIEEVQKALDTQAEAQKTLDDAIQRYGFTINELGPAFAKQKLDEQMAQIYKDWQVLTAAGVDHEAMLTRVGPEVGKLVDQYISAGVEIPSAMKPIIDDLYQHHKLLHANGEEYTEAEYKGISYAQTMSQMFTDLITHVQALVDAINGMVLKDKSFNVTPHYTGTPGWTGPWNYDGSEDHDNNPYTPMALGGLVLKKPGGTRVLLGEGGEDEFVIPRSKMGGFGGTPSNAELAGELRALRADMRNRDQMLPNLIRDAILFAR